MAACMFLLIGLLVSVALAGPQPTIKLHEAEKNTLAVSFPDVPGVNAIEFKYAIHQPTGHLPRVTDTVTVRRNAAGHFKCEVESKHAFTDKEAIEYSVKYLSASGDVVYHVDGVFTIPAASSLSPRLYRRGNTVFEDSFNSHQLNPNHWHHEITCWGGGNGEFQMYTPEAANTYIKNGVLYLKPTFTADKFGDDFFQHGVLDVKQQWGSCTAAEDNGCRRQGAQIPPIMSSKVFSVASITHGRVEVVAKIPKGDWIWPAIWLLPPGWPWKYGAWPASGEIDIMESRGNVHLRESNGATQGVDRVLSTIHYGASPSQHRQQGDSKTSKTGTTWADSFHTYSVDWTAGHIRMDIDNQPVMAWTTPSQGYWSYSHQSGTNVWSQGGNDAPFDGKMSLILNVAVGGTNNYFLDSWHNTPHAKPWKNNSPTAMMDFWKSKQQWQSTWHGEDVAMKVKSVKMIQY
ncbi:beta-1,3-glucan-binding protein-like [Haliotis rufescens]|uniref:beta-1,3-glucan-binding protein-like n=1 Tax=Haliotis rufescens TaxID=6454 RepID=UPI00201F13AF|nr:beta-1,3-glucan-binding protein-like [Haliotis rufescens]